MGARPTCAWGAAIILASLFAAAPASALEFDPYVSYPMGESADGIAARDFDGNGTIDVAATNPPSDQVSVRMGRGDGTLRLRRTYSTHSSPTGLEAADMNGDGALDLVTTNTGATRSRRCSETATARFKRHFGAASRQPRPEVLPSATWTATESGTS